MRVSKEGATRGATRVWDGEYVELCAHRTHLLHVPARVAGDRCLPLGLVKLPSAQA